jgi:hypothetical protein
VARRPGRGDVPLPRLRRRRAPARAVLGAADLRLSPLPAGAWSASVLALSAALPAIAENPSPTPPLPARFDVAEARLAFLRPGGAAPVEQLRAAGGAYDDGIGGRALAVWLALGAPDGTATAEAWDVEITGPNLPADDPLVIRYGARLPRLVAWAPTIPATPGTYGVVARSGETALATQLTVGDPAWLDLPLGVSASDGALGSARATWEPVAGAAAYLVRAYDAETGTFAASQWAAGTDTTFVQGTFTAGRAYQVFVAATDADMLGGAAPGQLAVSEDVFDFATFVAR